MLICLSLDPQPRLPSSTRRPFIFSPYNLPLPRWRLASFATQIFDCDLPPLPGSTSAQRYFWDFTHFPPVLLDNHVCSALVAHIYLRLVWFIPVVIRPVFGQLCAQLPHSSQKSFTCPALATQSSWMQKNLPDGIQKNVVKKSSLSPDASSLPFSPDYSPCPGG